MIVDDIGGLVGPISTEQDATTTTNLHTTQLKINVVRGIYARSLT